MKKIFILCCTAAISLCFSSCNDKLDTENLFEKDLNSFYSTPTEIAEAISGVYNAMYVSDVLSEPTLASDLLSDLVLAGGGPDDEKAKWVDSFKDPSEDTFRDLWITTYNGVYRANATIEAVNSKDYSTFFTTAAEAESFKNETLGETYFMRGFFLYRAAKFFGGMPLIMTTQTPRDIPRASLDDTYQQILSDLKLGIELMPNKEASSYTLEEYGHANKWVAEAYLARVYLYYTGYKKNILKEEVGDITLLDETTLTKSDVIGYLNDCINNSGYELLPDFRNLWPYSYINKASQTINGDNNVVLPWAEEAGLDWAGQDGFHSTIGTGNTEVMFAKRFAFGDWSWSDPQGKTNRLCLYLGIRENSLTPFGQGWGWGPINPNFYNQWDDQDLRKEGSVLELKEDPSNGLNGLVTEMGDQETGLVNKKFLNYQFDGPDGTRGMFAYLYNMAGPDMQLWHAQDIYLMRFADVMLMQSELTEDATYLNKVRKRAGLEEVPYSLDAIKAERMHEFAFEGLRWFDLVRWGDVESGHNFWSTDVQVTNVGVPATYKVNYRVETKGLSPIPESEIRLSNDVYTQNPGWE